MLYLTRFSQSKFGNLGDVDLETMVRAAGTEGLEDLDREKIGHISIACLLGPLLNDQSLVAGLVAMDPAYANKPITGVVNACDSGGLAVLDCALNVLAGRTHIGMALGVEKMNPREGKLDSQKVGLALGTAAHSSDVFPPFTFPHAFAVIMDEYMKTYGYTEEDLAIIPPIFYDNARFNPWAHRQKTKEPVTPEAVLASYRLFRDPDLPLKLFECSQISDGWARILVCDQDGIEMLGIDKRETTVLTGFGQATDSLSLASRGKHLLRPMGARRAFHSAMTMAKVKVEDIKVQEVHDCFSIMGPLAVETTGLADAGKGLEFFRDGHANRDGTCPINTSGGLIAKGHPISATGVSMIGWIHNQLLGKVPQELQVEGADLGTTLNIGGPICSTVVTVQQPAARVGRNVWAMGFGP